MTLDRLNVMNKSIEIFQAKINIFEDNVVAINEKFRTNQDFDSIAAAIRKDIDKQHKKAFDIKNEKISRYTVKKFKVDLNYGNKRFTSKYSSDDDSAPVVDSQNRSKYPHNQKDSYKQRDRSQSRTNLYRGDKQKNHHGYNYNSNKPNIFDNHDSRNPIYTNNANNDNNRYSKNSNNNANDNNEKHVNFQRNRSLSKKK